MSITLSREPRRSRQFWMDHVERWQLSGLSKAVYCEQQDIKPGSFYNWSSKVKSDSPSNTTPAIETLERSDPVPMEFHAITVTTAESPTVPFIHVKRDATDVTLPTDLTPEQIERWLSAIHKLHV